MTSPRRQAEDRASAHPWRAVAAALGAALALLALVTPANAAAETTAQRADRIMREVTSQMTHSPSADGVSEDQIPIPELVQRYYAGERLYIMCGPQSLVAQAVLADNGIRSRIVNTLAAQGNWDFDGDGHTFLEVWIGKRWIAYDPDGNRQFLDSRGHAIGAIQATAMRPFHFRYIASDQYWGAGSFPYSELNKAEDHAMGIPAIQTGGVAGDLTFSYHVTGGLRDRVEDYGPSGWNWVDHSQWQQITRGEYGLRATIHLASRRSPSRNR